MTIVVVAVVMSVVVAVMMMIIDMLVVLMSGLNSRMPMILIVVLVNRVMIVMTAIPIVRDAHAHTSWSDIHVLGASDRRIAKRQHERRRH